SSMPWPTTNPPLQFAPSRASASSFSSIAVTSQPSPSSRLATAEPTRPHPITIAFTCSAYRGIRPRELGPVFFEDALWERHDENLARSAAEHVFDRRREEPRLPAPPRRRAEHDQVCVALPGLVDDRLADRPCADGLADDFDAVFRA